MFFFYLCTYFSQHCCYNIVYSMPHNDNAENLNFRLEKHLFSFFSRVCVHRNKESEKRHVIFRKHLYTHTHSQAVWHPNCGCHKQWACASVRSPICDTMLHNATQWNWIVCHSLVAFYLYFASPLCAFCFLPHCRHRHHHNHMPFSRESKLACFRI